MAKPISEDKRNMILNGNLFRAILMLAIPVMINSFIQSMYNLTDTFWLGRIGTENQSAITLVSPFQNILINFGNGITTAGAILISQYLGAREDEQANSMANHICLTSLAFSVLCALICWLVSPGLVKWLGAEGSIYKYGLTYIRIVVLDLPFLFTINLFTSVKQSQGDTVKPMLLNMFGVVINLILDPLFIFFFNFGVSGAAIATVISQSFSAIFVLYFLTRRSELKMHFIRKNELSECMGYAKNIVSLGTAGFVMQITNSLVTICCNNVLSVTGGDIYISVMTIVSSIRQLVETPIYAINEGSSPILSYNYGAGRASKVKKAIVVMALMIFGYTAVVWSIIIFAPESLIKIFSSDADLLSDTVEALKLYFAAFIFMDLQYIGQTVFKSLNKKKQAIFFSLLRKVFIVVPLTYIMPYALNMGTSGVFMAEPVSNVIGGGICFVTMLCTVLPELKRMEKE